MRLQRYLIPPLCLLLILAGCAGVKADTPPAETPPAPDIEVNNVSSTSPDGQYLAEAYGVNTGVTSGGLYPAEGIRVVEVSSGKLLWQMLGYYTTEFLWSDNSRYLAVSYTARTEGGTAIVDTRDFSEIPVPVPEQMRTDMRSYRPDPYFTAAEWQDSDSILISFKWTGSDELLHTGSFVFVPSTGHVQDIVTETVREG